MRDEELDPRTEEAMARYLAVAPFLRGERRGRGRGIRQLSSEPIPWRGGTYRRRSVATLYRYLKRAAIARLRRLGFEVEVKPVA